MERCIHCGKELRSIYIGATKKFINRGSREFMCKSCLAKDLKVPEELIDKKSNTLKNRGAHCFCKFSKKSTAVWQLIFWQ